MSTILLALQERRIIEDNKQFSRLTEKTQVLVPQNGLHEVTKNRSTHSYECATSALTIAAYIAESIDVSVDMIDFNKSLENACLVHDIGHPSFGHDGADLIHDVLISEGLSEGFSDNNNNLVVIEKNNIQLRDYTIASTIKYPHNLYPEQVDKYRKILNLALRDDIDAMKAIGITLRPQSTTIACQIMDEADRNSYTFSDMTDFLCIGNKLSSEKIKEVSKNYPLNDNMVAQLEVFIYVAQSGSKSLIKRTLSDYKAKCNANYTIGAEGVRCVDEQLVFFRECLNKLTRLYYITPIRKLPFHKMNLEKLKYVLEEMLNGRFAPSTYYKGLIDGTDDKKTKLRAIRNMISEESDWYILRTYEKMMSEQIDN